MLLQHLSLGQAGLLEQRRRACIEICQVPGIVDNLGWIAITPFDVNRFPVGQVPLAQLMPLSVDRSPDCSATGGTWK